MKEKENNSNEAVQLSFENAPLEVCHKALVQESKIRHAVTWCYFLGVKVFSTDTLNKAKTRIKRHVYVDDFYNSCDKVANAFCEKHGFPKLGNKGTYWIGAVHGEVLDVDEYSFSMEDICADLYHDLPEEELMPWYEFSSEQASFNLHPISFLGWCRGDKRTDLTLLRRAKENLERELERARENEKSGDK